MNSKKTNAEAENKLKDVHKSLQSIVDGLADPIMVIDANYHVTLMNRPARKGHVEISDSLMCYQISHHRDTPCDGIEHPCPLEEVRRSGRPAMLVHEHVKPDGETRFIEISASPLLGEDGTFQGIIESHRDITKRRSAEEVLKKVRRELAIKNQIANIFLTIPDRKMYGEVLQLILDVMESMYGIFGYIDECGALIMPSMTRDIWEQCRVPDKTIVYPRETWGGIRGRALIEKGSLYANKGMQVPEGHLSITRILVVPIIYGKEVIGLLEVANKVTDYDEKDREFLEKIANIIAPILNARLQRDRCEMERKRTEDALRETHDYMEKLINYANAPIIVWDPQFKITKFNHAFEHLTGYTVGEVIGKELRMLFPDTSLDESLSKIESTLSGEYWKSVEIPIIRKDGGVRIVLWNSANIYTEDGKTLLATIAQGLDITERKRVQEALHESMKKYYMLFEMAKDAIFVSDETGRFVDVNQAACKSLGYTKEELLKLSNREIDADPTGYEAFLKVRDEPIEKITFEVNQRRKDGTLLPVEIVGSFFTRGPRRIAIAIARDITKRKQAEEALKKSNRELKETQVQLVAAGKLAAMGEMAAGVAHELTQPLLGIKGFTTSMLEDMKAHLEEETPAVSDVRADVEQAAADLEVMLQQIDRMTTIINAVLTFAHEPGTKNTLLDINQPIDDAFMLFLEQLRLRDIVVEKNLTPDLPLVTGNANHLQQVFINLITNARDAMDAKGGKRKLTVTTKKVDAGIHIEIEDTGTGADEETVSRMFEPFFTTKIVNEGTGLGLSIVKRIINDHRGTIEARCEPGRGCKFNIYLPPCAGGE